MTDRSNGRLCYVRLGVGDLRAASRFATDLLGLQPVAHDAGVAIFRSDARQYTLALVEPGEDAIGLEVQDIDALATRLQDGGIAGRWGSAAECADRRVRRALFVADATGNAVELVERPAMAGRRFFPPVDAGVIGLRAVGLRSRDIAGDTLFWTRIMGAEIADWVGEITYLRLDGVHHRVALYPSDRAGILYQSYAVADMDAMMRRFYVLADHQVQIVQGPGRETASGDIFLRVAGPGHSIFAFVVGEEPPSPCAQPRQFAHEADALCDWGSRCETVAELMAPPPPSP